MLRKCKKKIPKKAFEYTSEDFHTTIQSYFLNVSLYVDKTDALLDKTVIMIKIEKGEDKFITP